MGFNFNPLSWGTEAIKEGISHLPGASPYDARNPNSPVYSEAKTAPGGQTSTEFLNGFTYGPSYLDTALQQPTGGGAGGVLGSQTNISESGAAADPYASFGGQAGYDAQKQNIYGSATDAANTFGSQYAGGIQDFIASLQAGQRGIDESAIQNELAKKQGVAGIMGMVGRGIRSGGVTLANRNAADSSGAEAIARAYGELGRQQLSGVGNQYEVANRDTGLQQADLNEQSAAGVRRLQENKTQAVNNIVLQARNAFAQLDAQAAQASIPQRIQIEQEKEAVRQQVLQQLSQYDQQLEQGVSGVQPTSQGQRLTTANELATAGQAPANSFAFNTQAPAELQGSGPFASSLPIFTQPRRRTA